MEHLETFKEQRTATLLELLHLWSIMHRSPGGAEEFKPSALYIKWKS